MTTAELLWLTHSEQTDYLREKKPHSLRRYLMEVGDDAALIQHDRESMSSASTPSVPLGGRGRQR